MPRALVTPRDVPARATTLCSELELTVKVAYATETFAGTSVQRRIAALVSIPETAWRVVIGGFDMFFRRERLADAELYFNFAAAIPAPLPACQPAPPVWLRFPDLDTAAEELFTVDIPVHAIVDRQAGRLQIVLGGSRECTYHALAEGFLVGLDADDRPAAFRFDRVAWAEGLPVSSDSCR